MENEIQTARISLEGVEDGSVAVFVFTKLDGQIRQAGVGFDKGFLADYDTAALSAAMPAVQSIMSVVLRAHRLHMEDV